MFIFCWCIGGSRLWQPHENQHTMTHLHSNYVEVVQKRIQWNGLGLNIQYLSIYSNHVRTTSTVVSHVAGRLFLSFFFVMIDKTNLVCIPISGWLQPYHTALDNYNAINGRFECGLRGPNATPWSSTLRPSFTTDREAVRCGRNRGRRCLSKRALKSSQRSEGGST